MGRNAFPVKRALEELIPFPRLIFLFGKKLTLFHIIGIVTTHTGHQHSPPHPTHNYTCQTHQVAAPIFSFLDQTYYLTQHKHGGNTTNLKRSINRKGEKTNIEKSGKREGRQNLYFKT